MDTEGKSRIRAIYVLGVISFGFLTLFMTGLGQATPAATFTVNTVLDTDDGACNGVHCSLREAINAANNSAGPDIIDFSLPPSSTIILAGTQLPPVTDTLTIVGSTVAGLTISGTNFSRIFQIDSGALVTLTTLIIADGRTSYSTPAGAIYIVGGTLVIINSSIEDNYAYGERGGAIYNVGGNIIISSTTLSNNRSTHYGGGAIYNDGGNITLTNSIFSSNSTFEGTGGAIYNDGGNIVTSKTIFIGNDDRAIYNTGILAISQNNFISNTAWSGGGGIYNNNTLLITNSTFKDNWSRAYNGGGGIYNEGGTSYVTNSTFNGNKAADSAGGGILNSGGILNVSNSTFSGNFSNSSVFYGYGGGIANFNGGTLTISSSTFGDNLADIGGGIYNGDGGTFNFENTIIATSNHGGDCVNAGTIGTNLNNMVEDGSCNPLISGDPLLGLLQDNGGPTWTYALTLYSPAIDAGNNAACAAPPVNNLDQRGVIRPIDGDGDGTPTCDIGAYEYPLLDESSYLPLVVRN